MTFRVPKAKPIWDKFPPYKLNLTDLDEEKVFGLIRTPKYGTRLIGNITVYEFSDDLYDWMTDNKIGMVLASHSEIYRVYFHAANDEDAPPHFFAFFHNEKDALLFKLRWM